MKVFQILVLIFGLTVLTNAQDKEKLFVLSGTIYDAGKVAIPVGKYTIAFHKDGFKKSVYTDFENQTDYEKKLDVSLEITTYYDCGALIADEDKEVTNNKKIENVQNKSRFCGTITDEQGAVILNAIVEGKSSKGNFKIITDSNGSFDTEIFDGLYKILIKADGFKKVVMKNKLLPFEPRMCIQIELKSSVPPHQIT